MHCAKRTLLPWGTVCRLVGKALSHYNPYTLLQVLLFPRLEAVVVPLGALWVLQSPLLTTESGKQPM